MTTTASPNATLSPQLAFPLLRYAPGLRSALVVAAAVGTGAWLSVSVPQALNAAHVHKVTNNVAITSHSASRVGEPTTLEFRFRDTANRPVSVTLGDDFANYAAISAVDPLPDAVSRDGARQQFAFDARPDQDRVVRLIATPAAAGRHSVELGFSVGRDKAGVTHVEQFVLP